MDTHRGEPELSDGDQPPAVADDELLRQFVGARDEQAFGELVRRHSGLVLGVCRRTLRDEHDAEEAFQATFLVLAAKAARVRVAHTIGPWLYGVAYRTALRAAAKRARRRETTLPDDLTMIEDALQNVAQCHWRRVLDDELNLLPEKYRSAVVLHYLLGKSNQEVAAELGLSVRTVEGRQRRGKELLKRKLLLRGASLPLALGALAKTQAASAYASAPLIDATIEAGLSYINGNSAACSADAVRLAQSEVLAMTSSVAPITVTLGALLLLGAGIGLASGHAPAQGDGALPLSLAVQAVASASDGDGIDPFSAEPAAFQTEGAADPSETDETAEEADMADLVGSSLGEKKINRALRSNLREPLDFIEQPLREVAAILSETYDIPILFDIPAFDSVAASPDVEVTFTINSIPLHSALRLLLRQSGTEQLTYIIRDDVLMITTQEEADTHLEAIVYDVREIVSTLGTKTEEIGETITKTVAPEHWASAGTGEGSLQVLGKGYLVVSQSQAVHEEITKLLSQMRRHGERERAEAEAKSAK